MKLSFNSVIIFAFSVIIIPETIAQASTNKITSRTPEIGSPIDANCIGNFTVACSPEEAAKNEPVCGCDGVTYLNGCLASARGVRRTTPGKCISSTITPTDECKGNKVNKTCTTVFDPVCGCDGQTYSNSCTATSAGVKKFIKGECQKKGNDNPNDAWIYSPKPKENINISSVNSNGNNTRIRNQNTKCKVDRSLVGCAALYDHLKNWRGNNDEKSAAKVDFTWYPNDPSKGVNVIFNPNSGNNEGLIVQLDPIALINSKVDINPLLLTESNIDIKNIIIDLRNQSSTISPFSTSNNSDLNKKLDGNIFVLNSPKNLMTVRSPAGFDLYYVRFEKPNSKGEIWARSEIDKVKYLVKMNWIRGELDSNSVFNEIE